MNFVSTSTHFELISKSRSLNKKFQIFSATLVDNSHWSHDFNNKSWTQHGDISSTEPFHAMFKFKLNLIFVELILFILSFSCSILRSA